MHITIEADTPEELKDKILKLAEFFLGTQVVSHSLQLPLSLSEVKTEVAKEKKTKKSKPVEVAPEVKVETAAPTHAVSKDSAAEALKKVNEVKGTDAVLGILSKFNYTKVREIKEEQCADILRECESALAE